MSSETGTWKSVKPPSGRKIGRNIDGVMSVFRLIETTSNVGAVVAGCASTAVVAMDIHDAASVETRM